MSTTEELAQSHNGIGGISPVLNADNINTRHEPPVISKAPLMNSQDGPRPENEISAPESNQTNQDVKKSEEKEKVSAEEEKKADDSSSSVSIAAAPDAVEPPIQKVTVSLLTTAQSQNAAEKSAENSSGHEKVDEPMEVDQEKVKPKEKESKEAAAVVGGAPETSTAEKGEDDESPKEKEESDEKAAETEKSAEEAKESGAEDHPKDEAGAEEKSPQKKSPRGKGRAKRTKTDSESATTPKKEKVQPQKKAEAVEEGEEAESASKEEKTPLLEAPLIVEGKRSRQRVERLDSNALVTPLQREFDIPAGKGTKLGGIEFIDATISKAPTAELKILHRLIYGRVGTTPAEIKKNLRMFCGFDFTEDSKEYERKKRSLDHLVMRDTKTVCKLLGLEVGGRKDDLVDAVLRYLVEPVDKGKKVPQTPTTKRKRATTPSSSRKRSAGGRRSSRRKADATGDDEEEEETAEGDEEEEEDAEEKSEEDAAEEEEPSAKKSRRGKPAAPATPTASTSKRGQSSRSAKKSQFPADSDIKAIIKELLKGVNLEEVTMKEMTTKVYDKFPGVDLTSKKDFIKETVKALLSTTD